MQWHGMECAYVCVFGNKWRFFFLNRPRNFELILLLKKKKHFSIFKSKQIKELQLLNCSEGHYHRSLMGKAVLVPIQFFRQNFNRKTERLMKFILASRVLFSVYTMMMASCTVAACNHKYQIAREKLFMLSGQTHQTLLAFWYCRWFKLQNTTKKRNI